MNDNPWSVDVNWGDGSTHTTFSQGTQGSLGSQSHTYADNGAYTVTVKVTDKDTGSGQATFTVNVANIAPSIAISGNANVNEGSPYSLTLGAVTDPGSDTVSSYVVHWGDGSQDTYASNGLKTHTYADGPNDYNITVDLIDEDGTFTNRANPLAVHVNNVAPTVTLSAGNDLSVNESSTTQHTYSYTISDPGQDTVRR